MFRALLKKQMLELLQSFSRIGKNKRRSGAATTSSVLGAAALLLLIMISLGAALFSVAQMLSQALVPAGLEWLYFLLMFGMALVTGMLGSVFTISSSLYNAKDNELLLSMPIPPRMIVSVRLIGISLMGMAYTGITVVPAFLADWLVIRPDAVRILALPVMLVLLTLMVMALSSILGYGVARLTMRFKNRSLFTVLFSLLFLGAYYFFYFRFQLMLEKLIANADRIAESAGELPLLVRIGQAGAGNGAGLLLAAVICILPALIAFTVLCRSFIRIATQKNDASVGRVRERKWREMSVSRALLRRERQRFLASAVYMLNCGLGLVFMLAAAVMALVKAQPIRSLLDELLPEMPQLAPLLPLLVTAAMCLLGVMTNVTAPSVSLEGKTMWVIRTLPVEARDVLRAKLNWQIVLFLPCVLLTTAVLCAVLEVGAVNTLLTLLAMALFVPMDAALGLFFGVKHANLSWTNETVAIKQSTSVLLSMLADLMLAAVVGVFGYFGSQLLPAWVCLLLLSAVFGAALMLLLRWLDHRGAQLFAEL